jgi:mono/diheme cytochrome c family protein
VQREIRGLIQRFPKEERVKKVSTAAENSPTGSQLYKQNCALCHAEDGKGNDPPSVPSIFTASPPDLTTLAQRHNGKFPEAYVAEVLHGGVTSPDRGPAEMPVWGIIFKSMSKSDETQVKLRMTNLTNYLKTIQKM